MIIRLLGAQWLAVGFTGLVSLGLSVFIARTLGPDLFGVYSIALSAGALLAILMYGGFSKLLQRERTRVTPTLSQVLPDLPGLSYGHAMLVVLGLSVVAVAIFPKHALTTLAALWLFGAMVLNQFGLAILRGDGRLVRDASLQVGNRTFAALCVAAALLLGASQPWQVLIAQFIGTAAFGFLVARYLRVRPLFRMSPMVYRAILPFVWLDFATALYFRADMLVFQFLSVPKLEVGQYGVAYRLIEAVLLLASPVGLILFRRYRQDSALPAQMIKSMGPALMAAGFIGLGLALMFWMFGPDLISLAYGPAFQGGDQSLMVLGCALVFILPNGVLIQAFLALGLERWFAFSASIAAVVNIGGNLLLIPIYGTIAAAWMTVLTEVILGACLATGLVWRCRQPAVVATGA
jgi:O-antigen/teichoic acid export membrane protein